MIISIVLLAQHLESFKKCIARIELHTKKPYEIIVVNDGGSNEIALLAEPMAHIKVLDSPDKIGVAAGYNLGAKRSSGDVVVFMRDHMLVSDNWLSSLLACLDKHEDAAMVGPISNDVSGKQRCSVTCDTPEALDKLAKAIALSKAGQSIRVPRLLSQLVAVRRSAFDRLGGFDERFGLETYEDDDFSYRAMQAGFGLYIAQDCFVNYVPPLDLFPGEDGWMSRLQMINKSKAFEKWGFDLSEALYSWKHPITISLCMIVKDEEQTLGRCLASVRELVDEIVIVDTGSKDKTKEIARSFSARVEDFNWVNDFAKARNYAFSLATQEYILWLDADDIILPEDALRFKRLKEEFSWDVDAVSMEYHLAFDERGQVTSSLRRNRLVRRENGCRWIGPVHEYLEVYGRILQSDINVTHDRKHENSSRNLHIYESRLAAGEELLARDSYYYANELKDHERWDQAARQYEKFLAMPDGWVEDKIAACGKASDCLRELGFYEEAKKKTLQSFAYDLPRAENCCRLGQLHLTAGDYRGAVYWYESALRLDKPSGNAPIQHACWTWLPHLQLCVCYDRLGQKELANESNEKAAKFIPEDSRVLANRLYFESLGIYSPLREAVNGFAFDVSNVSRETVGTLQ